MCRRWSWTRGRLIHFGKYELLSRINIGGMAEIVKARDTQRPGQPLVAVKRILPHLCEDQQYKTMFLDESRVLAQLDHEAIIHTFEIGEVDGTPYIALEFIDGQDARMLFHKVRRVDARVPISVACYVIARVCDGLHHAHEQTDTHGELLGLVHRDVSLQNVLLSYDGDVKLTDFGIAMSTENVARTEVGIVKGKFGYMSPEQIKGAPLDRRSDVFAAGICLYELLTGERLFSGDSDYEAVERVRNAVVQPPSSLNRQVPSGLERIVMKALAKHPRDRYQSANDLRKALLAFANDSRQTCSREDLAAYLREVFADDIGSQRSVREQDETPPPRRSLPPQPSRPPASRPSVTIPAPGSPPAAHGAQAAAVPSAPPAPRGARVPSEALTGLAAFDNLDQVSALNVMPDPPAPPQPVPAPVSQPPAYATPVVNARASVPPGYGSRPGTPSAPSVPPVVPRRESIPGLPPGAFLAAHGHDEPPVQAPSLDHASSLDMDWDDDEPPTQSRGFDGVEALPDTSDESVTGQLRVDETFPDISADTSGHFPPTLGLPATSVESALAASLPTHTARPAPRSHGPIIAVVVGIVALIAAALFVFREPAVATLRLTTAPHDAIVTLDGVPLAAVGAGRFEITAVEAGKQHTLTVEKPGHAPWSTKLSVHGGQTLELPAIRLEPLPGTEPPAKPDLEVAPVAPTPLTEGAQPEPDDPQTVAPAAHTPEAEPARAPVARPRTAPARVKSSRKASSSKASSKASPVGKGTLRINTRPWSRVLIDGKLIGNTPQQSISLSAGSHKVKLVNPEFGISKTITVEIVAGQTVTKVLTLQD